MEHEVLRVVRIHGQRFDAITKATPQRDLIVAADLTGGDVLISPPKYDASRADVETVPDLHVECEA